ncbi:MAG: hypothetical protein GY835_11570 [bacterium]|nr:hypothetical protein [bacterium]
MNPLEAYIARSNEIIGDRTSAEVEYDAEVIKWLRRGKSIAKAIEAANRRHPGEALAVEDAKIEDVSAHYDYLLQHEEIMKRLRRARGH